MGRKDIHIEINVIELSRGGTKSEGERRRGRRLKLEAISGRREEMKKGSIERTGRIKS